jgi:hypothetical protein
MPVDIPLLRIRIKNLGADALFSHSTPVETTDKTIAADRLLALRADSAPLVRPDLDFAGAGRTDNLFRFGLPDLL